MPNKRLTKKLETLLSKEIIFNQYKKDYKIAYHPERDCWYRVSPKGRHTKIKEDYVVFYFPDNLEEIASSLINGHRRIPSLQGPKLFNTKKSNWLDENYSSLPYQSSQILDFILGIIISFEYQNLEPSMKEKFSKKDIEKRILKN